MADKQIKKVVLAYSGGLDTSIIIPWLKENYGDPEIIAVSGDVGQGTELDGLEEKALKTGASKLIVADLTDEMVDDVIIPSMKMGAQYETYLLGTAFARPIIGKKLAEIALAEGADAVCLLLRLLHNGVCLAPRVCHDPVGKLLRLLVCCMDLCQILIRRRLRRLKHPVQRQRRLCNRARVFQLHGPVRQLFADGFVFLFELLRPALQLINNVQQILTCETPELPIRHALFSKSFQMFDSSARFWKRLIHWLHVLSSIVNHKQFDARNQVLSC